MSISDIETIQADGKVLAIVIRHSYSPSRTTFLTPNEFNQQVGYIVYAKGSTIPRHRHMPQERRIMGTSEVIWVKSGRCRLGLFDDAGMPISEVDLATGDLIVLVSGGHGFEVEEDTTLVEVKQGPFIAGEDKVYF